MNCPAGVGQALTHHLLSLNDDAAALLFLIHREAFEQFKLDIECREDMPQGIVNLTRQAAALLSFGQNLYAGSIFLKAAVLLGQINKQALVLAAG